MQYDTKGKTKAKLKQQQQQLVYNTQKFPSSKKGNKLKFPSQACKLGLVKGFGEDIYELVLGANTA